MAVEFKFPRGPSIYNSADTMTFSELLKDLYRVAAMDVAERWVVQLLGDRLAGHLERRTDVR